MQAHPFFSILIPTRNRPDLITKAIDSVLAQTYKDYEIVIIDNSTDELTKAALGKYSALGHEFRYIRTGSLTMPDNWETSYNNARAKNAILLTDRMYFTENTVLDELHKIHQKYPEAIITYSWNIEGNKNALIKPVKPVELNPADILKRFFNGGNDRGRFNYESPKGLNTSLPVKIYNEVKNKYGRMCFPLSPDFGMSFVLLHEAYRIFHVINPLVISGGMTVSNGNQNRKNKAGIIKYLIEYNYPENVLYEHTPVPIVGLFNSMYNDFFSLANRFGWSYSWNQVNRVEYFLLLRDEIVNNEYQADKAADMDKWGRALSQQPEQVISEVNSRILKAASGLSEPHNFVHELKAKIKKVFR